ncbi:MAG: hypothetical protein AAGG02_21045, partial [Cyanobacteria bacterium P01_H01_bin.15]
LIHSLTEGNGFPLSVCTTAANGDERQQVLPLLDKLKVSTPGPGRPKKRLKVIVQIASTWGFSGYKEITTEAMKDTMAHYEDPSYFNSDVADLILDSIFNETNEFGVLLTRENVEQCNDQLSLQRKQWLIDRPSDAQFVQAVVLNKRPEK